MAMIDGVLLELKVDRCTGERIFVATQLLMDELEKGRKSGEEHGYFTSEEVWAEVEEMLAT